MGGPTNRGDHDVTTEHGGRFVPVRVPRAWDLQGYGQSSDDRLSHRDRGRFVDRDGTALHDTDTDANANANADTHADTHANADTNATGDDAATEWL